MVGKALAEGGRRKRVWIATKVGLDWQDGHPSAVPARYALRKRSGLPFGVCVPISSISIRFIGLIPTCRSKGNRESDGRSAARRQGFG
jgi:hypothetical protein